MLKALLNLTQCSHAHCKACKLLLLQFVAKTTFN